MSARSFLRYSMGAFVVVAACATAVDDEGADFGSGGTVGGDTGGTTSTGGTTTGTGGVFGAGGFGGANTGGSVFGTGGVGTGGVGTGGMGTGGAGTGGMATGGMGTGGVVFEGDCADKPTYADWEAGSGQMTGDLVIYSCTVAQAACAGLATGTPHLFECISSHVPNCTTQTPQAGDNWEYKVTCDE